MPSEMLNQPTFIDLFSGAGGFSCGFKQAGFRDLLAIEIDSYAAATYKQNYPEAVVLDRDLRSIHSLDIIKLIGEPPDVIIASPPCEPFTLANPKRFSDAWSRFYLYPNGDLIFHALRIITDLQPKFFVIENVFPMIDGDGKIIIEEEFKRFGWNKIYFNIINAEMHGCPSKRKRVFISNIPIYLPKRSIVTVGEAFAGLPRPSLMSSIPNHVPIPLPQKIELRVPRLLPLQAAIYFKGAKSEKRNWIRLSYDKPAPTVMGKSRFIHPEEDRALTIREHARLMTFPDNFVFLGPNDIAYNQVGEAVPPLIAYFIAKKIRKKL
ncbi:MAG: DNA cytosine methyltransferase [Candidatus Heimdallarchaeaceae archaeon]